MTFPLLTDSQGNKFGKTAGGTNVWLDTARTSVFDYYQFWRNCEDSDVQKLLSFFTTLPVAEIMELSKLEAPAINRAKEILAFEATKLAHGETEAVKAYVAAGSKFGFADPECKIATSSAITAVKPDSQAGFDDLPTYELPKAEVDGEGLWIVKLLTDAGLSKSNGESRRLIQGGGAYLNDQRITDFEMKLKSDVFANGPIILKAGKKNIKKIVLV
jgi:tyrosyl-tRNA synthetase